MKKTILSFVFCVLAGAPAVFAQGLPVVRLGNIESPNATLEQILAYPRVAVMNPTYYVSHYSLSIVPKGKDLIGPFTNKDPKLTDQEIDLIRQNNNNNTRIFIEDVYLMKDNKEVKANNVVVNLVTGK